MKRLIKMCGLLFLIFVTVLVTLRWICKPRTGYLADNESWSIDPDDWMSETEKYWWDE